MKQSLALLLSAGLSLTVASVIAASAFWLGDRLGAWQWLLCMTAILAAATALVPLRFVMQRGTASTELAAILDERLQQVERREQELADRLADYQQWFEFPPPEDVVAAQAFDVGMLTRDRKLDELVERKTQDLFGKIRNNEYAVDKRLEFPLIRDDIYAFVSEIAALYGDDPQNPLAGVSSERILRAASRCCLKFLIELDRLPLDIHKYDLNQIYGYVRQAINVYDLYRSASPYLPWLRGAYYGTWLVMGANPVTLGAWWAASSLGTKGAKSLAAAVANRWALSFLHDVVRIIAYEVAGIYDGSLRYRDPNWHFAAELTELIQSFPSSEASLRRALSLIGALQLRNEYDRMFFFRCIVEGKRARIDRVRSSDLLPEQRKAIAERLESFLASSLDDPPPSAVERWRAGVEQRLDIALLVAGPVPSGPLPEQRQSALRSLAGYLLEIKQVDPDQLQTILQRATLAAVLPDEERDELWQSLVDDPPFFFQMPEIGPAGPVAKAYLKDLAVLAVQVAPRYAAADELVISTAVHLRSDARAVKKALDAEYVTQASGLLPVDSPNRCRTPELARVLLDLIQPTEPLRFLYGEVQPVGIASSEPVAIDSTPKKTWLAGIGERLLLFTVRETPELIWQGDRRVQCELIKGRLRTDCRIRGGTWTTASTEPPPCLLIRGNVLGRSKRYFAPLFDFMQTQNAS